MGGPLSRDPQESASLRVAAKQSPAIPVIFTPADCPERVTIVQAARVVLLHASRFCNEVDMLGLRNHHRQFVLGWTLIACGLALSSGCQQAAAPPSTTGASQSATPGGSATESPQATADTPAPKRTFAPVQLGGSSGTIPGGAQAADVNSESVLEELQPLQVLLGKWSGNARSAPLLHELQWVWDFQSNPAQPALVVSSEKSNYIRAGRLTYLPRENLFTFRMTTPEGEEKNFRGTFSKPVADVAGDDQKLQRTFKLELQEEVPADATEQWQVAFHQLENNRYLMELDRKRGSGKFIRVDTVHSQREGTSFALSDSDYGDKTCIISQGLGVISVSYQGKSYWVCCSGCQAAFNDDPEKWIAKWEAKQKEMTR